MTQSAVFSPYQLKVLALVKQVENDAQMEEISDFLSNYFAQKAVKKSDRLWDEGLIENSTIEEWKHERMRTAY